MILKIKRASGLFGGDAFNGMGVNHGHLEITMPQQLLNRADIIPLYVRRVFEE
jgi:hypothetical protein